VVVSKKTSPPLTAKVETPEAGLRRLTHDMNAIRLELRQLRDRLEIQNRKIDDLKKSVGSLIQKASGVSGRNEDR